MPDNSSNSVQFIAATGAFKRVDTKGNSELDPETATTVNVGAIFDSYLGSRGSIFFTADYWSYDFKQPLVTEPFNDVLARACPGGPLDPCDESSQFFSRWVFGGNPIASDLEIVNLFIVFIVNGPDIKTDGVDLAGNISFDDFVSGQFTLGCNMTQILSYDIGAWDLGGAFDALGRLNYRTTLGRSLVEVKGRGYLNYAQGGVNVRLTANFVGEYVHTLSATEVDIKIPSHMTYDLGLSWGTPASH